jgi:hypothetical protein
MHGSSDTGAGADREAPMPESPAVPGHLVAGLRRICLALPDGYEERAWVGTRWLVRRRTFAHVLGISDEYPPAHARDAPFVGVATVLTFRATGQELAALTGAGPPFFKPRWHPEVVGVVLPDEPDWAELTELLTESYCLRAPRKLVARVPRPAGEASSGP